MSRDNDKFGNPPFVFSVQRRTSLSFASFFPFFSYKNKEDLGAVSKAERFYQIVNEPQKEEKEDQRKEKKKSLNLVRELRELWNVKS